ncbi:CBS domain-containing protein [Enterobacter oligotrophicus]|uniref:CBS domain-containing protein n=1 Tax=Enterobacter oligotrophicus TaxID=2478464 RepID=UPI001261384B|nr:CBS domain-containing protein [Enterobacter oligotrophicus]
MDSKVSIPTESTAQNDSSLPRQKIGGIVLYGGMGIIAFLLIIAIMVLYRTAGDKATLDNIFPLVKDLIMILLPVISAWISTVIAFYFSRDSLNAVTQHAQDIATALAGDDKLKAILASEVMRPMDEKFVVMQRDGNYAEIKLYNDLLDAKMKDRNITRLPVLDSNGVVQYIIHQSMITEFIARNRNITDPTLQDLLNEPTCKAIFTRFGVVGTKATLLEAKKQIDQDRECQDVIVTLSGERAAQAIGWITNTMVEEKSRV